jgi:hypothetical protein
MLSECKVQVSEPDFCGAALLSETHGAPHLPT